MFFLHRGHALGVGLKESKHPTIEDKNTQTDQIILFFYFRIYFTNWQPLHHNVSRYSMLTMYKCTIIIMAML